MRHKPVTRIRRLPSDNGAPKRVQRHSLASDAGGGQAENVGQGLHRTRLLNSSFGRRGVGAAWHTPVPDRSHAERLCCAHAYVQERSGIAIAPPNQMAKKATFACFIH